MRLEQSDSRDSGPHNSASSVYVTQPKLTKHMRVTGERLGWGEGARGDGQDHDCPAGGNSRAGLRDPRSGFVERCKRCRIVRARGHVGTVENWETQKEGGSPAWLWRGRASRPLSVRCSLEAVRKRIGRGDGAMRAMGELQWALETRLKRRGM